MAANYVEIIRSRLKANIEARCKHLTQEQRDQLLESETAKALAELPGAAAASGPNAQIEAIAALETVRGEIPEAVYRAIGRALFGHR